MRSALTINEFLDNYQQKPNPGLYCRQPGLGREIKSSRQAAVTFDAADCFDSIRTPRITVVGCQQSRYIDRLDVASQASLFNPAPGAAVSAIICGLAPLVEAAASNHRLQISGYNSAQDLISRQNQNSAG